MLALQKTATVELRSVGRGYFSAYFSASILLGLGMLAPSVRLARSANLADARRVMFASLLYLPFLFAIMAADKVPVVPW